MKFFEVYRKPPLRITKGDEQLNGQIKRILLIQLGDIGDLVLSIPTIRSLKENYPSAHLTVAARDKSSDLVNLCQWSDGVLEIKKEKLKFGDWALKQYRFFRDLRSRRFDMIIDMRTGTRGGILAFLSGARIRIGFTALEDTWRNYLFTHLVYPPMDMPMLHMAHYHLLLLDRYGLDVNTQWPRLRIEEQHDREISDLLIRENVPLTMPLIAIQPFSLWRYKEWPPGKFRQLVQWILSEFNVAVLICGTLPEHSRVERMIAGTPADRVFNMAGQTTISQYAALLARCRLLIGCDSAGVHIAAAVETSTATIYGPTSPKSWAPREHGHVVISSEMDCAPCRQKGCRGSGLSQCLEDLSVEEVVEKIEPLLIALAVT